MSISAAQYTMGTSPAVKIVPAESGPQEVHIHCETNQGNPVIYLGASTVTTSTGMHVNDNATLTLTVPAGIDLWAVASSSNTVAGVLRIQL